MKFRKSRLGLMVAGVFLALAAVAFGTHIYSVATNPADSGLSALWFYLLASPWMGMIPESLAYSKIWGLLAYPAGWSMVLLNSFILYCVFGGLRFGHAADA